MRRGDRHATPQGAPGDDALPSLQRGSRARRAHVRVVGAAAPVERLLAKAAAKDLKAAIAEAGGNEVFALGRRDAQDGPYTEIRVVARGHRTAVPAILDVAEHGDVALHNHPSGDLTPSQADLGIASMLADAGVAFAIVDSSVERAYVVVEPFPGEGLAPISEDEVAALLGDTGPIARLLDGYEARPAQLSMARSVVQALNGDSVAALEAGTGTGKSLAYLVPAAAWAHRNKERVVVATGTIHLQEQIVGHDLPLLTSGLPFDVQVALVKGRGNYLGLRRLEVALEARRSRGEQVELGDGQRDELTALEELERWSERTQRGSLQELPFKPPEGLWEEVRSDGDACLRLRCPHYGECFYFKSRREASRAGIIVANHHLLFADVAIRSATGNYKGAALLPPYQRVILDEAHRAETAASAFFGVRVTRRGVMQHLGRLGRFGTGASRGRGLLPAVAGRLKRDAGGAAVAGEVQGSLAAQVEEMRARAEGAFTTLDHWLSAAADGDASGSLRVTLALCERADWKEVLSVCERLAGDVRALAGRLAELGRVLANRCDEREDPTLDGLRLEVDAAARRLRNVADGVDSFAGFDDSGATDDGLVRWFEWRPPRGGRPRSMRLHAAPLDVGGLLAEAVWEPFDTHVLTSATLTTTRAGEQGFDYLADRLGLDRLEPGRVERAMFPSPFDFARQALVVLRDDLPAPGSLAFEKRCAEAVLQSLRITQGRAFVLFTSHTLLRRIHDAIAPTLRNEGLVTLRQGEEPRTALLDRFRSEVGAVLFGTDSFWEGVDVRGDALQHVIITRLPFRVPTEPLVQARAEAVEARGGNSFAEVTVPEAVIRFKQGFGRLIRHRTDRGSLVVLDPRVATKSYGRRFLDALPDGIPVVRGDWSVVEPALRRFHGSGSMENGNTGAPAEVVH